MSRINRIVCLFILSIICSYAGLDSTQSIDTTFVVLIDCTGDGVEDSIVYRISGSTWMVPLTATYTIKSAGKTILDETSSDEALDGQFPSEDIFEGCTEYLTCKKEWYFNRVPKKMVQLVDKKSEQRESLLDSTSGMSIPDLVGMFYADSLGYSRKKTKSAVRKLTAHLRKNDFVILTIPVIPIYPSIPRIYDPTHKRFIGLFGL